MADERNAHGSHSSDEGFFNDLSQQPVLRRTSDEDVHDSVNGNDAQASKAKRTACVLCRRRKLRCDGIKPTCGTCNRLSHDCAYDEVRRKSGPKRGYVKALEARLAQVETLLKTQDGDAKSEQAPKVAAVEIVARSDVYNDTADLDLGSVDLFPHVPEPRATWDDVKGPLESRLQPSANVDRRKFGPPVCRTFESPRPRRTDEVITLGLEEPMPNQDDIYELNQLYFERVHGTAPMIHRPRFRAAMDLGVQYRPPVCLLYAMWANVAVVTDKYEGLHEHFYRRARKYAERDEMSSFGELIVTTRHVQTWFLIGMYEYKMTYFPRAWMSCARACKLALMLGMNRLDGKGLDIKQCLPPPRDWIDKEERRRTFWMTFCEDRYASIGTGWPMTIDELDITTNLPADDDSFEQGRAVTTSTLRDALDPDSGISISSMAGVVITTCLMGRNLLHLHRPSDDDDEGNLDGAFWKRHRHLDNILLNVSLGLPDHLRMPYGLTDCNTVFLNMCIHTSTICLHQAAIFKADANKISSHVASESKMRCLTAATETASIMRMISHQDTSLAHGFLSFSLYVAARVFIQYLKARPQDHQTKANLHFLITAMNALKRKNLLTESFLIQLDVDMQGAGLEELRSLRSRLSRMTSAWANAQVDRSKFATTVDDELPHKRPPTFGDSGLAKHTSPEEVSLSSDEQGSRLVSIGDFTEPQWSGGSSVFSPPKSTSRTYSIPERQKTPSANATSNPSPDTMDDMMDYNLDLQEVSSQGSHQLNTSSHTSTTNITPSSNEGAWQWQSQPPNAETRAVYLGDSQPAQSNVMDTYGEIDFGQFTKDGAFTAQGFVPADWSASGTGLTPGSFDRPPTTGLTPAQSADVMNLSDAEWKKMLDDGQLDMGWEANFADNQGFHFASPRS